MRTQTKFENSSLDREPKRMREGSYLEEMYDRRQRKGKKIVKRMRKSNGM